MGVDSTALLLRWLCEPKSRDFDLDDLVVLTAQTGDEFKDTQRLVETHMLPLLRELRVRYVQVARGGPLQGDGIVVLDDGREPQQLFIEGRFKLSQELLDNGTVPQVATGQRRCTHHFKGFPLTAWTDREFGSQRVRKVIGYNVDERGRATRSEGYATDTRSIEYPSGNGDDNDARSTCAASWASCARSPAGNRTFSSAIGSFPKKRPRRSSWNMSASQ
jgi:hypothetical protein